MTTRQQAQRWRFPNGYVYSVTPPYYPASCDYCGWQGSSESCGVDRSGDDSDVYCPVCHRTGCDHGKTAALAAQVRE